MLLHVFGTSMTCTDGNTSPSVAENASISRRSFTVRPTLIATTPRGFRWLRTSSKNSRVVRCQGIYGSLYASMPTTSYDFSDVSSPKRPSCTITFRLGSFMSKYLRPTSTIAGSISKPSIGIGPKTRVYCLGVVPAASPTIAMLRTSAGVKGGSLKNGAAR